MKNNNKTLLISDIDLDGFGSMVLATGLLANIHKISPERRDLARFLKEALKSGQYETIVMTDCSPKEELIDDIEEFVNNGNEFVLLDHHKTALHLNEYAWSRVKVETNGRKHSGTELFYLYLKEQEIEGVEDYYEFVELVRSYDTWDWFHQEDEKPNQLNQLFSILGKEAFVSSMVSKIKNSEPIFSEKDKMMLSFQEEMNKNYIKDNLSKYDLVTWREKRVAVFFQTHLISILGSTLCEQNKDIDFALFVDFTNKACSLRGDGRYDVSILAKELHGGGHAKASGFPMNEEIMKLVSEIMIKREQV